jgi:ferrous iron transport protein B
MLLKTKAFVFGAGKIILAISIVLWFIFYGPGENSITETIQFSKTENAGIPQEELDNKVAAYKLENSYIGIMGKVLNLLSFRIRLEDWNRNH